MIRFGANERNGYLSTQILLWNKEAGRAAKTATGIKQHSTAAHQQSIRSQPLSDEGEELFI